MENKEMMNKAALFLKELRELEAKHGFRVEADVETELDYAYDGEMYESSHTGVLQIVSNDGMFFKEKYEIEMFVEEDSKDVDQ